MSTFKTGDRVVHARYPSYGIGTVTERIVNPHFPSLPTGRSRVQFGHITRECVDADLGEPATMRFGGHGTRLVCSGGEIVA